MRRRAPAGNALTIHLQTLIAYIQRRSPLPPPPDPPRALLIGSYRWDRYSTTTSASAHSLPRVSSPRREQAKRLLDELVSIAEGQPTALICATAYQAARILRRWEKARRVLRLWDSLAPDDGPNVPDDGAGAVTDGAPVAGGATSAVASPRSSEKGPGAGVHRAGAPDPRSERVSAAGGTGGSSGGSGSRGGRTAVDDVSQALRLYCKGDMEASPRARGSADNDGGTRSVHLLVFLSPFLLICLFGWFCLVALAKPPKNNHLAAVFAWPARPFRRPGGNKARRGITRSRPNATQTRRPVLTRGAHPTPKRQIRWHPGGAAGLSPQYTR